MATMNFRLDSNRTELTCGSFRLRRSDMAVPPFGRGLGGEPDVDDPAAVGQFSLRVLLGEVFRARFVFHVSELVEAAEEDIVSRHRLAAL